MRLLPLSHLLAGASAVALLIGVSPSIAQEPVAPSPATVQCGASCQVRVTMAPASGRRAGSSPWLEAYTTLHFDLRNTSPVSPPMFINLEMAGENPTFYVRAVNANGNVLARSEGFNELVGGLPRPMDPVRILAPGESLEFYQDIKGFLAIGGVHRFELMRGGNVVATLPFNIDEYLSAERRMFRNGQLHKMISTVPLHPNGAGLVGDWRDRDGQRSLTLSRNGWTLIGTLRIGGIGARRLELHSGPSEAEYMGRISDETGQTELGRVRVTVLSDGTLKAESLTPQATGQALTGLSDREVNWVLMRPAAVPSPPPPTAPPPPPQLPPPVAEPTPAPPSPAEPVGQWTAAAYQPWVGTWWFGGEYIVIGSGDGELTAEWFDASANRTKKANLQFDLGRSNPQRLVGLSTEVSRPGISDLELTIAADKQSILMFGGHPQFPFGGQLRRVAAMGDRPTLPSAPAVINQLSAAWDTPMGRLQFSAAGTGELRGQVTGQPRGLALTRGANGRPIDSNVDAIDMYFETVEEFGASTGQVRVIPGADGRTVTILRLEGEAVFGRPVMTARKTGSSSAPQPLPPPDIPSPPGDNPAPGTGAGPTQPPAPTTPPTDQPAPEPVPPSLPEPDPLPPGDSAPTPSEPVPPTPVPVPPTPRPQPPEPQPTPPVVQPTPPQPAPPQGGAGSVPGSGGYQGISQTWDVQFEGARVERGAEVHVFVSVKNRSTSDQYITPGTFIPNLGNQDGEVITSRAVYRASGDNPTEFRPTVPVNEAVRVRFIFRPEAGSAQPRTFTLESFGHRKLTFDVSGMRVSSLAQ